MVARYHAMKDHGSFLAAAEILSRAHPSVLFALVGEGMSPANTELACRIESHGLHDRVLLLGPRSDIATVTAAFDIAALSSVNEGFPNAVGEAMSCGVPCVVTDVGDAALIIGDSGLIVQPGDPAAMSAAWSELLVMGNTARHALGLRARQRIVDHFSIDAVARQYERLFEEVVHHSDLTTCAA
jgi:glycosyltransferase involved in cell wall biosynthesis